MQNNADSPSSRASSSSLDGTTITVPDLHSIPVLYPHGTRIIWITQNGEITVLDRQAIAAELALGPPLVCHRRWSEARSGVEITSCLDLMELFAFARPARFCLPTPAGLAAQLSLPRPHSAEDMAAILPKAAFMLLDELALLEGRAHEEAAGIAGMMGAGGWMWGPLILAHMGLKRGTASTT